MKQAIEARRPSLVEAVDGRGYIETAEQGQARPIVVVLGMHRSGTSLCSHILSVLGVDMTDDVNAHPFNARGEWERFEVRDFNDRVLDLFDRGFVSPHHDLPLPAGWWADPRLRAMREDIAAFIRRRMPAGGLFGFKDPRTARLLPAWHQVFAELQLMPHYILCIRNPAQVARSLTARDGVSPEVGECRWFCYMAEALGNMPDSKICKIEYEDWFLDPNINLHKLAEFLDLPVDGAPADLNVAIAQIVDPYLRHDQSGLEKARQPLVRSLYETARNLTDSALAREDMRTLADQFAAFRELYRPLHEEFERASKIAATLPGLEKEIAALRAELEGGSNTTGELETEIAALRTALTRRDAAVAAANDRSAELAAGLARAEAVMAEQAAKLGTTEAALSVAQAALAEANRRNTELEAVPTGVRTEIAEATSWQSELAAPLATAEAARGELEQAAQTAAQHEEIADAAQSAIDELRARLTETEREAAQVKNAHERLWAEHDRMRDQRDRIRQQRDRVAEERDRFSERHDRILQARNRLQRECERLRGERDRVSEQRDQITAERNRLHEERDRLGEQSTHWFDAAILARGEGVAGKRARGGWRIGRHVLQVVPGRGRGSPMDRADDARDARQWERAARFYADALEQLGTDRPAIWVQFAHSLKEAGKFVEAEFAYRRVINLDKDNIDALVPLGQLLRRQGRDGEAAETYLRALELRPPTDELAFLTDELAALGYPTESRPRAAAP
jgi:hypothetical protein